MEGAVGTNDYGGGTTCCTPTQEAGKITPNLGSRWCYYHTAILLSFSIVCVLCNYFFVFCANEPIHLPLYKTVCLFERMLARNAQTHTKFYYRPDPTRSPYPLPRAVLTGQQKAVPRGLPEALSPCRQSRRWPTGGSREEGGGGVGRGTAGGATAAGVVGGGGVAGAGATEEDQSRCPPFSPSIGGKSSR